MLSGPGLYRTETHAATGSTRARAYAGTHTYLPGLQSTKMRKLGLSKILRFSSLKDFDQMCVESKRRKVNNL